MAARRYDQNFSSSVEKSFTSEGSEQVKYFSTQEEKFCISKRPCNVLLIYYININEIPNHFTLILFWCERCDLLCSLSNGDIFTCEDNKLFSHVKISCFRGKAHLVCHLCLHSKFFLVVQGVAKSNPLLLKKSTKKVEKNLYLKYSITFY